MKTYPPKPPSRPEGLSIRQRIRAFRQDMFRSQPAKLYRALVARQKTPFFTSFFVNDPAYTDLVLSMPKARGMGGALKGLLGRSVFVTNGPEWERQRRIIDPAFGADRLRDLFAPMQDAARAALDQMPTGRVEVEAQCSYFAADVIFRTLFSIPITQTRATKIFDAFRAYQRAQPMLSSRAVLGAPKLRIGRSKGAKYARIIRAEITALVAERQRALDAGTAPDDLATRLMTQTDPQTGAGFSNDEMVDQVAIFFLAGHETSASALAWGLYCLAQNKPAQDRLRAEVLNVTKGRDLSYSDLRNLPFTRDVWKEILRLYPPVPVLLRESDGQHTMRKMPVAKGDICMISPWYVQRSPRQWDDPDAFDPDRWQARPNGLYLPYSKGPRVCPGAGFATLEGAMMLAMFCARYEVDLDGPPPVPVAHLTVRAEDGIYLSVVGHTFVNPSAETYQRRTAST